MSNHSPLSLKDKPFLAQVWSLAHPYWRSDEKRIAWLLLGLVVGLNYLIVEVAVLYSNWNRDFFNLMQNEEWNNFWNMLGQFVLIMAVYTVVDFTRGVFTQNIADPLASVVNPCIFTKMVGWKAFVPTSTDLSRQ